jgi:hypothetical protein
LPTESPSTTVAYPDLCNLRASYADATAPGLSDASCVRIGGHNVQLRFGSGGLVPCIMPAFAHLTVDSALEPELVVNIWDSRSADAAPPRMPDVDSESPAGAFYFFEDPPVRGVFQPGMRALSVLDHANNEAWYFVEDPAGLPYWERAAPIRQILHWWMGARGHQQVHSGAVGLPDGGALLVGKGGSGKSTTALASLASELRYAGDDYVMVSLAPQPWVHSLYSSGKVHPDNLARVPHLVPALSNAEHLATEKGVAFVDQHFPDRVIEGFPLQAIVMPTITGRSNTRVVPASRAAALAALAPSTVFQLHTAGAEALQYMARLVRQVPAYILELGNDVSQIPGVLLELLSDRRPDQS